MSADRRGRAARLATVAALALALAAPISARAEWTNCMRACGAGGIQFVQAACSDGAGGVIVTWMDARNDPSDIYVQRIDAGGNPLWTSNGVVVCNAAGGQASPAIAPDGFGGALITWADARNGTADIYVTKVTPTGAVSGAWPANGLRLTTSAQSESGPLIAASGLGDAFIAWTLNFGAGDDDVYCTRVSAAGNVTGGWPAGGLGLCTLTGNQRPSSLVSDASGYAYVVWDDARSGAIGGSDIYGACVSSGGTLLAGWNTANGKLICNSIGAQTLPTATSDGVGGLILAWQDQRNGNLDVFAQRYNLAGSTLWALTGTPVTTLAGSDVALDVVTDGSTGAFVSWLHRNGAEDDVYVQHLSNLGHVWAGFAPGGNPICISPGTKSAQQAVPDGAHGVVVGWTDQRDGTNQLYAQHVSGIGRVAYRAFGQPTICTNDFAGPPSVVSDGDGGAILAWSDDHFGDLDIFALRFASASNVTSFDTPNGWDYPIIPRNDVSNVTQVSPTLDGNLPDTRVRFAIDQRGPYPIPSLFAELRLDDDQVVGTTSEGDGMAPGYLFTTLGTNLTVRGGRHQLSTRVDPGDFIVESDENDDEAPFQFVWSPLTVTRATALVRSVPPPPGILFTDPNCDGFKFVRNSTNAWVVGEAPLVAGDDDDLYLYTDYSNSTSGFSALAGYSVLSGTATDFVVGHYANTPVTMYPAVTRFAAGAAAAFALDATDSQGHEGAIGGISAWTNQLLAANRLVEVYEAQLTQGEVYQFVLSRTSGTSDLRFVIFSDAAGGIYNEGDGMAYSVAANALTDTVSFPAPSTGWFPIVIYRPATGGALTYNFDWNRATVDAPLAGVPAELALSSPWPNPTREGATLELDLPRAGHVELSLYDLAGRRVRTIAEREFPAGRHVLTWDGGGENGVRAGAGLYWLRLQAGGRTLTRRVAVLR